MPFPSPDTVSEAEFTQALDAFRFLLENLPEKVPYKAAQDTAFGEFLVRPFQLDEKYMDLTGDECSTISEQLKRAFGWNARIVEGGLIEGLERGPGLVGIHEIISQYHQKHPNNIVLKKWALDIVTALENVFEKHGQSVRIYQIRMITVIVDGVHQGSSRSRSRYEQYRRQEAKGARHIRFRFRARCV